MRKPQLKQTAKASGAEDVLRIKRNKSISMGEFMSWDFPDEEPLLGPVFTRASTGMLSAPRGLGKSLLVMNIAYSVAAGKTLQPWGTGARVVVAYLDGEMHSRTLQKRLRQIRNRDTKPKTQALALQNLHIIGRDAFEDVIGYIDNEEDQVYIESLLPEDCQFLIVDNLSAWTSSAREDGGAFAPIKRWLARLRTKGIGVLLVHHTGKTGVGQRGSSIHEDMLDYSILLSADKEGKPKNGTSFLLEHTKLRELQPDLPQTCRFTFTTDQATDVMHLAYEDCENAVSEIEAKIIELLQEGKSGKSIAEELGVRAYKVSRVKTAFVAQMRAHETQADAAQGAEDA